MSFLGCGSPKSYADSAHRMLGFTVKYSCEVFEIVCSCSTHCIASTTVALGSIFVRIFGLVVVFGMCQFLFKMNPMGLVSGMFVTYFSYLVVEISYIHKKSLSRGE